MNTTHNILCKILLSIVVLFFVSTYGFSQEIKKGDYPLVDYVECDVHTLDLEQVNATLKDYQEEKIDDMNYTVYKAILLFRKALLTFSEEDTLFAFEYWADLYANKNYQNPLHLVYTGSLEAMHGGAILTPEPLKKINWANRGIKKMQEGIDELERGDNNIALAYAYFLQGSTYSQLPTFFKEFPLTSDSLKYSLKEFSRIRKEKLMDEQVLLFLVSYTYNVYGDHYLKAGEVKKAKKYYGSAKKYLDQSKMPASLKDELEKKISELS